MKIRQIEDNQYQSLQSKNEEYKLVIDNSPDMILSVSKDDGKILRCNKTFLKKSSHLKNEIIGKSFFDLFRKSCQVAVKSYFEKFRQIGEISNVELTLKTKDGRFIDVSVNANTIKKDKGEKDYGLFSCRDITLRKNAEKELVDKKNELDAIFNNTTSILILLNREMQIVRMNRAGLLFVNLPYEKTKDNKIGNVFHCIFALKAAKGCGFGENCPNCIVRNTVIETINNQKEFEKVEASFTVLKNRNISKIYVLLTTVILRHQNEDSYLVIFDDITERVKIEHALKESDKQKNQFISVVSHDIRSKLTEMTSAVMLLSRNNSKGQNDKNTTLHLDLLKSALDNSLEMFDELLQWGGMITGRAQFTYQNFNPIRVIEKTEEFLEDSLKNKNIQILIEHPDDIVIHADKTMFSVLVRNLIANAIKFSYKNKTITVIGKKIIKRISVDRISQESYVEYCIKDNGVGIEPDKLENLFTNLKIKSTPGTSGEKGTGLGLMLCKEIVEKHNGKIWVESEPDKGSSFYFQIPETQIN